MRYFHDCLLEDYADFCSNTIFLLIVVDSKVVEAESLFVTPSGSGAKNGSSWSNSSDWFSNAETNIRLGDGSTPFVDYQAGNYQIVGTISDRLPRNRGNALPAPYNNIDPLGVTRGADGKWDIGAFEYATPGTGPPSAPKNLGIRQN